MGRVRQAAGLGRGSERPLRARAGGRGGRPAGRGDRRARVRRAVRLPARRKRSMGRGRIAGAERCACGPLVRPRGRDGRAHRADGGLGGGLERGRGLRIREARRRVARDREAGGERPRE